MNIINAKITNNVLNIFKPNSYYLFCDHKKKDNIAHASIYF